MSQPVTTLNLVLDRTGRAQDSTILFLHAGGETRSVWKPITTQLLDLDWQMLAPDLRGHGESDRAKEYQFADFIEDVEILIEKLCGRPLIIVGGSMGGLVGLMIAGRLDSPVDGLILLDVIPAPPETAGMREKSKIAAAISRGAAEVSSIDPAMVSGSLVENILLQSDFIRSQARQIQIPTLLIYGQLSHAIGEKELQSFREDVSHAEIISVNAGHLVARDRPEEVAKIIRAFILQNEDLFPSL